MLNGLFNREIIFNQTYLGKANNKVTPCSTFRLISVRCTLADSLARATGANTLYTVKMVNRLIAYASDGHTTKMETILFADRSLFILVRINVGALQLDSWLVCRPSPCNCCTELIKAIIGLKSPVRG